MKSYIYNDNLGKDITVGDVPEDMKDLAEEYRSNLLEAVSEYDDEIMMLYLEGEEIPEDMIKTAIRKATLDVKMIPVVCGTSYRNKGVQKLLDAVIEYMPSPLDKKDIAGIDPDTGDADSRPSDDNAPFSALAFKIMTDPFVGKLCFFRVYSGTINAGSHVLNSTKKNRERLGRILQMHANHREDIETVYSGDIAAAVGLKNTTTGDTLCDEKAPIILESMEFPEPVIRVAIEPKTKAGQEKMGIALAKLAEEDPTFRTYTDEETGQTIIAGMGELHLEIIVDRLLREFKVEANVGAPQVAYKETIRKSADSDTKYARQSGGKGQYGHCKITVEPNESGKGYEFINKIVGGAIPKEYIEPINQGIQGAMQSGVLAGYNVVDIKVTLYDGSYHEVDSSEMHLRLLVLWLSRMLSRRQIQLLWNLSCALTLSFQKNTWATLSVTSTPAVVRSRVWKQLLVHSRSLHSFHSPKCSVTQQICVPEHRAVVSIQWNHPIIQSFLRTFRQSSSKASNFFEKSS